MSFGGGGGVDTSETPATGVQFQSSAYGLPAPLLYGCTRISPNLIWYGDFTAIAHTEEAEGGKGGGGGGSSTSYTYTASFLFGLGEGEIHSVRRAWVNKEIIDSPATLFQFLKGGTAQGPWSHLLAEHASEALYYPATALAAAAGYDLGRDSSLPNHNFEVVGLLPLAPASNKFDADPAAVVLDFLTHPGHGVPNWPGSMVGDLSAYSAYCRAAGLLLSLNLADQVAASQTLTDLISLTNAGIYFSEGKLKVTPYGDVPITANGVTYIPPINEIPNLDDDDFIAGDGEDPVIVKRNAIAETGATTSDAYNQVQIKFRNRANAYQEQVEPAQDLASIERYGLRPMPVIDAPWIQTLKVAAAVAQLKLQRTVSTRNQYEFKLGWAWVMLEPTDIVTLTDSVLGLDRHPVRILEIEESEDGVLAIIAEDAPPGVASHVSRVPEESGGYALDYNAPPGPVVDPVFVEPPIELTQGGSGLEVWVGVSGAGAVWGGADVWVSYDGVDYKRMGRVTMPARVGKLTAGMTAADTGLSVAIEGKGGALLPATTGEAEALFSAIYVGGDNDEFMAYAGATLAAEKQYALDGLVRGAWGSAIAPHLMGSPFVRLDSALVKSGPLALDLIGKTIYFKFQSFNVFETALEDLATVPVYAYVIAGYGATGQPVTGLAATAVPGSSVLTQLSWDVSPGATHYFVDQSGDGIKWLRTGEPKTNSWAGAALFGAATRFRVAAVRARAGTWSSDAYLNIGYVGMWNANPATPMWNVNASTPMWSS